MGQAASLAPSAGQSMKDSILYVGDNPALMDQRAGELSERFLVMTTSSRGLANVLNRTRVDVVLLCESVSPEAAALMIFSIRCQFPLMTVIRLEEENASEVPLYFQADYVVHASRDPLHWVDEVQRACSGTLHL